MSQFLYQFPFTLLFLFRYHFGFCFLFPSHSYSEFWLSAFPDAPDQLRFIQAGNRPCHGFFDPFLTSKRTREKLQCLYDNLMLNNFRKTTVMKKI